MQLDFSESISNQLWTRYVMLVLSKISSKWKLEWLIVTRCIQLVCRLILRIKIGSTMSDKRVESALISWHLKICYAVIWRSALLTSDNLLCWHLQIFYADIWRSAMLRSEDLLCWHLKICFADIWWSSLCWHLKIFYADIWRSSMLTS